MAPNDSPRNWPKLAHAWPAEWAETENEGYSASCSRCTINHILETPTRTAVGPEVAAGGFVGQGQYRPSSSYLLGCLEIPGSMPSREWWKGDAQNRQRPDRPLRTRTTTRPAEGRSIHHQSATAWAPATTSPRRMVHAARNQGRRRRTGTHRAWHTSRTQSPDPSLAGVTTNSTEEKNVAIQRKSADWGPYHNTQYNPGTSRFPRSPATAAKQDASRPG